MDRLDEEIRLDKIHVEKSARRIMLLVGCLWKVNEMFYNRSWIGVSIKEFIAYLDDYLHWYNEDRIKITLGGMSQ